MTAILAPYQFPVSLEDANETLDRVIGSAAYNADLIVINCFVCYRLLVENCNGLLQDISTEIATLIEADYPQHVYTFPNGPKFIAGGINEITQILEQRYEIRFGISIQNIGY
jgi:hypothetical protein